VGLVPAVTAHVVGEITGDLGEPAQETAVLGQLREPLGGHAAEESYGIVFRGGPALGIDGLEEITRVGVPGPAQIARQITERSEGFGENGTDGESTDRLHSSTSALRWMTHGYVCRRV
jgi:hypothetical protein